ncbi:hypothetical protein [Chitinilyticum piscinae]|uniref:Uncharacterized protein n=1 Tax=Chitinilyticum piscinae TaxID=2866724 RepID=A0A8J7K8E3_9NEIS|nr:hypothetical protein [Chitinilyticum piscinae]MBE9609388.1 hypothetical protein [Chitinilyticum piscinae]
MMRSLLMVLSLAALSACASPPATSPPPLVQQQQRSLSAALAAEQAGRWQTAIEEWQYYQQASQLLDDWSAQARARLSLTTLLLRGQEYASAYQQIQGVRGDTLITEELRAQAALLEARVALAAGLPDGETAWLQATQFCQQRCAWRAAAANVRARQLLQSGDHAGALALIAPVLADAESPAAERSHALRMRAEVLLRQTDVAGAAIAIAEAIRMDRQLGEPLWLIDDYRLQAEIAGAQGDAVLERESRRRLDSLCRAYPAKTCAGA